MNLFATPSGPSLYSIGVIVVANPTEFGASVPLFVPVPTATEEGFIVIFVPDFIVPFN